MSQESFTPSMFDEAPEQETNLEVVQARFLDTRSESLSTLLAGYSRLRVLTYSNSVSLVTRVAEMVDEIEIIFGREDLLHDMARYLHYQELLLEELIAACKGRAILGDKLKQDHLRLYVVQEMVSHEKLFLLEGAAGQRVISGSANFSERAFSGSQNESYICFDNDPGAWAYFTRKYERIKAASSTRIAQHALLEETLDLEALPAFAPQQRTGDPPQILVVDDRPPAPTIIQKVLAQAIPRRYSGLNSVITTRNGVARIDRATATRAVQYAKSNARTQEENPQESLTIYVPSRQVILSGKPLPLAVSTEEVARDIRILTTYFAGYHSFKGDAIRLAQDYFTFMCWFYISPLICDFRNQAQANDAYVQDFPLFGILYGKSNCGKSELVRTLLLSMFGQEGFLPNDWFTKTQVDAIREQNKRYPMVFDDLDKTRFRNHGTRLIKEDYLPFREYPPIVLSMNADQDTFETEIRKRSLIIYTGASLPDHTGESRKLAHEVKTLKKELGTALYRAYLGEVMDQLQSAPQGDMLQLSSRVLTDLFHRHQPAVRPPWCRIISMEDYGHAKHDKVRDELLQLWQYNRDAWELKGNTVILRLDMHGAAKLRRDIPDYMIGSGSRGDVILFDRRYLEEFLGVFLQGGLGAIWRRFRGRSSRKGGGP